MKKLHFQRELDDVAEALRNAKLRGTKCTLLVGAGCSVEAGIPTAAGFIERIQADYHRSYQRADPKTYAGCMAELPSGVRHALIAEYVDQAKVNWGHIGIALLMQHGYTDRVLTTNFDSLLIRACAMLGEFPAVYDFAASQRFKPEAVPAKAVFHLHGQRTGFVLLNTRDEFDRHAETLGPVFQDAGRGRMWIVAGYSGENDPVFEHLARITEFEHGLYWLGYGDAGAPEHVAERLLVKGKYAYFVSGYTADSFFIELAQKLGIFPPLFIGRPFSYLATTLQTLAPFAIPGQLPGLSVTDIASEWINAAISRFERESASPEEVAGSASVVQKSEVALALEALMAGDHLAAIRIGEAHGYPLPSELLPIVARAYVMAGDHLAGLGRRSENGGCTEFAEAQRWYEKALSLKPDLSAALNNWGNALVDRASSEAVEEADRLLEVAERKFAEALTIKSDQHDVLSNWGIALVARARLRSRKGAPHLLEEALKKFAAMLQAKYPAQSSPMRADLKAARAKLEAIVGILIDAEQTVRDTSLTIDPIYTALRNSTWEAEALLDRLRDAVVVWRDLHARTVEWPRFVQFRRVAGRTLADWAALDEETLEKIKSEAGEYQVLRERFAAADEDIRRLTLQLLRGEDLGLHSLAHAMTDAARAVMDAVNQGRQEPYEGVLEIEDILRDLREISFAPTPALLPRDPAAELLRCLAVLGLTPGADRNAVKRGFRTLAMRYHPDHNSSADATERFREIVEAYEFILRHLP